ncbi:MAG: sodium:solute symporter, partial [Planctomycetota bacterium]
MKRFFAIIITGLLTGLAFGQSMQLDWQELPSLPDPIGVAGPFVGVHNDVLLVAGGANFPTPVWENDKVWRAQVFVVTRTGEEFTSQEIATTLPKPMAYGAAVSTKKGVVCIGGNNGDEFYSDVFRMEWVAEKSEVRFTKLPSLPKPCAYGQATLIGNTIYLAGGQSQSDLSSAMKNFWSLDLSQEGNDEDFRWIDHPAWPGFPRAFNLTVAQHNGYDSCVYVMSGRRQERAALNKLPVRGGGTPESLELRRRADEVVLKEGK